MGKKRHVLVDTLGLLLHAIVHPADVQDRDGGVVLLSTLFGMYPFLLKLYADAGYQGPQFADGVAKHLPQLAVEIVKRSDQAKGFAVLPMRWVVERTLAWLNRCRRLAKDFEISRTTRWHSCGSPPSVSCYDGSAILRKLSGPTLSEGAAADLGAVVGLAGATLAINVENAAFDVADGVVRGLGTYQAARATGESPLQALGSTLQLAPISFQD